jgi:transposase InsO family protein
MDTGAQVNLISSKLLKNCKIESISVDVRASSGDNIPIEGLVYLELKTPGAEESSLGKYPFLVVSLEFDDFAGILGMPFLQSTAAQIDCRHLRVKFKDGIVCSLEQTARGRAPQVAHVAVQLGRKAFTKHFTVRSQRNVTVPPKTRMVIQGRVKPSKMFGVFQTELVTEPETLHEAGVYVGSTYVGSGEELVINIPVMNTSEVPFKIRRKDKLTTLTPILEAHKIDPNEFLVNTIQEMSTVETSPSNTPEKISEKYGRLLAEVKCSEEYQEKFRELLTKYDHLFAQDGEPTGICPLVTVRIDVKTDKPLFGRQYPLPFNVREPLNQRIEEFVKEGILRKIEHEGSEWNSPVWCVIKKDGTVRLCIDFRELNKILVYEPHPLPRIDEVLGYLGKAKWFSTFDLIHGFHNFPLAKECQKYTAITVNNARYVFNRMPMGLKSSPAMFQRSMDFILQKEIGVFLMVYMDDIVIYSETEQGHLDHIEKLFTRIWPSGLRFKLSKCSVFQKEVNLLGHLVSEEGITIDPAKIEKVKSLAAPRNIAQLQSFLGLMNYFRRYIPNFAQIGLPLYRILKGESVHKKNNTRAKQGEPYFDLTQEQLDAAERLKSAVVNAPVLRYPDFERQFILTCDASAEGLGCVLEQKFEDGEHPVAFASRKLNDAETRYSNTDREALAVFYGIETFRPYLYGVHFLVRTDHKAVEFMHKGKSVSQRVMRWHNALYDYNFSIEHVPGTKLRHADALSRLTSLLPSGGEALLDEEISEKSEEVESNEDNPLEEVEEERHSNQNEMLMAAEEEKLDEGLRDREDEYDFIPTYPSSSVNLIFNYDKQEFIPQLGHLDWPTEQKRDIQLRQKYHLANNGSVSHLSVNKGILYQLVEDRYVVLVPKQLQAAMVPLFHGSPAVGHPGSERTYRSMRRYVYWPKMKADVEDFVKFCDTCQRIKRKYGKTPLQNHIIPNQVFKIISMDFVGPTVQTTQGEKYILVIQDMLSRWLELIPTKHATAEALTEAFMTQWVPRYGVPQQILTDQGSAFISQVFLGLCKFLGTKKIFTTAYRPQSNGANERSHQEIAKYLSAYLDPEKKEKWRWLLGDAAWAHNTSYHSALKCSPYEALFGHAPPIEPLGIPRKEVDFSTFQEYYGVHREQLIQIRKKVQTAILQAQEKTLKHANKNAVFEEFKVGDWVLYKRHRGKKWEKRFEGAWKVSRIVSPVTTEIELGGYLMIVHNSYLKPYHSRVTPTPAPVPSDFSEILELAAQEAERIQNKFLLNDDDEDDEDENVVYEEQEFVGEEPPDESGPTDPPRSEPSGSTDRDNGTTSRNYSNPLRNIGKNLIRAFQPPRYRSQKEGTAAGAGNRYPARDRHPPDKLRY